MNFIEYMDTHSRILELAYNSEIENSQNKSHAKISGFTVSIHLKISNRLTVCSGKQSDKCTRHRTISQYLVNQRMLS